MSVKGKCAIAGLGVTPMGKIYGRSATDFALEAIELALQDAGLRKDEVDGLLINANMSHEMNPQLQQALGLENLSLLNVMNAYGSTAGTMIQYASMAIDNGLANVVVLVYADDPLKPAKGSGASYSGADHYPLTGMTGLQVAYGTLLVEKITSFDENRRRQQTMSKRPYVGVGVIVMKGDQVLLMRRRNSHGDGTWSNPGGHLEYGESPEACSIRETQEETGVIIADVTFRAITNDLFETEEKHYVTIWMEGRYVSGEPRINSQREMSEVGWFSWDALPQPLFLPLEHLLEANGGPSKNALCRCSDRHQSL